MMKKRWMGVCIGIFVIWLLWGSILVSLECVKMKLPERMHLYEEDAVKVLSGAEKTISPELLSLDFNGSIEFAKETGGGYAATCQLFGMLPIKTMEVEVVSRELLYPGGIPVGIYVETDGIFVIGTGMIETDDGVLESPAKNIVKTGDYITSFQGKSISEKKQLVECLSNFKEEELVLGIRREKEEFQICISPVILEDGAHIGVWVRDDTQGVGTLTYVSEEGKFGALGHGISDEDSGVLMEVSEGNLYDCEIMQIVKGQAGIPGKIRGKIVYSPERLYGQVTGNLSGGIYGKANEVLKKKMETGPLPIALKQEISEGEAMIRSSVSGTVEEYKVEIVKIHRGERDVNKGMEIKVTDERLLKLTGGIIRGMSGSPVIQNGRIVGAVTHVLVNDPTRGYGIFIENMLEAAE